MPKAAINKIVTTANENDLQLAVDGATRSTAPGSELRAVFRQARQLPRRSSPVRPSPAMQGYRMARAGRPKGAMAKLPAVNDNRTDRTPDQGDECREELMAMPDVGALD